MLASVMRDFGPRHTSFVSASHTIEGTVLGDIARITEHPAARDAATIEINARVFKESEGRLCRRKLDGSLITTRPIRCGEAVLTSCMVVAEPTPSFACRLLQMPAIIKAEPLLCMLPVAPLPIWFNMGGLLPIAASGAASLLDMHGFPVPVSPDCVSVGLAVGLVPSLLARRCTANSVMCYGSGEDLDCVTWVATRDLAAGELFTTHFAPCLKLGQLGMPCTEGPNNQPCGQTFACMQDARRRQVAMIRMHLLFVPLPWTPSTVATPLIEIEDDLLAYLQRIHPTSRETLTSWVDKLFATQFPDVLALSAPSSVVSISWPVIQLFLFYTEPFVSMLLGPC